MCVHAGKTNAAGLIVALPIGAQLLGKFRARIPPGGTRVGSRVISTAVPTAHFWDRMGGETEELDGRLKNALRNGHTVTAIGINAFTALAPVGFGFECPLARKRVGSYGALIITVVRAAVGAQDCCMHKS